MSEPISRREFIKGSAIAAAGAAALVVVKEPLKVFAREAELPTRKIEKSEFSPPNEIKLTEHDAPLGLVPVRDPNNPNVILRNRVYLRHGNPDANQVEILAVDINPDGSQSAAFPIENLPALKANNNLQGTFLGLPDGKHFCLVNTEDNGSKIKVALIDPVTNQAQILGEHSIDNPGHGLTAAAYDAESNSVYYAYRNTDGLTRLSKFANGTITEVTSLKGPGDNISSLCLRRMNGNLFAIATGQADSTAEVILSSRNLDNLGDQLQNRQAKISASQHCCPVAVDHYQGAVVAFATGDQRPALGFYNPTTGLVSGTRIFESYETRINLPNDRYPRGKTLSLSYLQGFLVCRFIDASQVTAGNLWQMVFDYSLNPVSDPQNFGTESRFTSSGFGQSPHQLVGDEQGNYATTYDSQDPYQMTNTKFASFIRFDVPPTPTVTATAIATATSRPTETASPTATVTATKPATATATATQVPVTATPGGETATPVQTPTVAKEPTVTAEPSATVQPPDELENKIYVPIIRKPENPISRLMGNLLSRFRGKV